jgi:hypothetical protein
MPNPIVDVTIHGGVRPGHGPVGEIALPPTQLRVQVGTNLFPWSGVVRTQQLINARSQTFEALLRRSHGKELFSGLPPVLWTESVSQKVEVLRAGVADARLLLVQGQSDTGPSLSYGLQICSPTFRGLGCEASMKSVTRLHRSSAIQEYQDLLVRDFHPLVIRAARAHDLLQIEKGSKAFS